MRAGEIHRRSLPGINGTAQKAASSGTNCSPVPSTKPNENHSLLASRHEKPSRVGHLAGDRSNIGGPRKHLGWSRLRPSVVVPIGVIVAGAIVCAVAAALGARRRSHE